MQALLFILNTLLTLIVVAYLLRVLMPMVRADFRNPIGQAVLTLTNPLVLPLRRILPASKKSRLDAAAVVALVIVQLAGTALLRTVAGAAFSPLNILIAGLLDLAGTILQFYFVAILIYALLSWFQTSGYNPAHQILSRICEPVLAPVRRVIPPLGGLDLSALFVLIVLQALQIMLR